MPPKPLLPAASTVEAITKGYFAQVRFILNIKGGANCREVDTSRTPLILCTFIEDLPWSVSLARLLLEKGAKVGLKDKFGLNALHYACIYKRLELAQLFLKAIDYHINDFDKHRHTALFYAVHSGCYPICTLLIETLNRFFMSVDLPNKESITPLMEAWKMGHFEIAKALIAAGADLNAVNKFGVSVSQYEKEAIEKRKHEDDAFLEKAVGRRLRFNDVDGWRRHQNRIRSAPLALNKPVTFKEEMREKLRCRRYKYNPQDLIHVASPLDIRNNPTEIFRTSPIEFFSRLVAQEGVNSNSPTYGNKSSYKDRRLKSAQAKLGWSRVSSAERINKSANLSHSTISDNGKIHGSSHVSFASIQQAKTINSQKATDSFSNENINTDVKTSYSPKESAVCTAPTDAQSADSLTFGEPSFKCDIPTLYSSFEYQVSHAYRKPAKEPTDVSSYVTNMEMYTAARSGLLPLPSADGESGGESTPVKGKKDRKERKSKRLTLANLAMVDVKKKGGRLSRTAFNKEE